MALRAAGRALSQSPWYAAASVGTIALTAALSTTVFGVVDGVLFKSLPFRSPDRMYIALGADASGRVGSLAPDDLVSLRRADPRIAIAGVGRAFRLTSVDRPDLTIWAREIDPQFFDVVGVVGCSVTRSLP